MALSCPSRVRPGGRMMAAGRSLLEERFATLAARTLWWPGGVRRPMEQHSPIGLPNQRPARVLAAVMDLDRPAGGVVRFMDERFSRISAELGGSIIREMSGITPRIAGVRQLMGTVAASGQCKRRSRPQYAATVRQGRNQWTISSERSMNTPRSPV
jgi:hypothetical protein